MHGEKRRQCRYDAAWWIFETPSEAVSALPPVSLQGREVGRLQMSVLRASSGKFNLRHAASSSWENLILHSPGKQVSISRRKLLRLLAAWEHVLRTRGLLPLLLLLRLRLFPYECREGRMRENIQHPLTLETRQCFCGHEKFLLLQIIWQA